MTVVVESLVCGRPPLLSEQLLDALDGDGSSGSKSRSAYALHLGMFGMAALRSAVQAEGGCARSFFGLGTERLIVAAASDASLPMPGARCGGGIGGGDGSDAEQIVLSFVGPSSERVQLSLADFVRVAEETVRADLVICPYECVHASYNGKHAARAALRSLQWAQSALRCWSGSGPKPRVLLLPVVGGSAEKSKAFLLQLKDMLDVDAKARTAQPASASASTSVGLHLGNLRGVSPETRAAVVGEARAVFGDDVVLYAQLGGLGLRDVAQMARLGVDYVESTLPYVLTKMGRALLFLPAAVGSPGDTLNLLDPALSEDAVPLHQGCVCWTCKTHTRAYIHHLLVAKELLGPMLVQLHNCHTLRLIVASCAPPPPDSS